MTNFMQERLLERKTYLTPNQEEELIRRLYTCPKVNVYPTRLYEDLPPLKFWSSPAGTIESYLCQKVFHRRLQLAYEFNQSKEAGLSTAGSSIEETQNQLTQAMFQLTSDLNYFQQLASTQVLQKAQQKEVEIEQGSFEYQNKALWDKIHPPESVSNLISECFDNTLTDRNQHQRLLTDIKNRFINYENFYKLKNVLHEVKKPLAETIRSPPLSNYNTIDDWPTTHNISRSDSNFTDYKLKKKSEIKRVTLRNVSDSTITIKTKPRRPTVASIISTGRLPLVKYSSNHSLNNLEDLNKRNPTLVRLSIEREDNLLPTFSKQSFVRFDNTRHKGTSITLRDSLDLNQKRMSCISKSNSFRKNKATVSRTSNITHRDSMLIVVNKKSDKPKPVPFSSLSYLSEFSFETNKLKNKKSKSNSFEDDQTLTPSLVDHRDSIELASQRIHSREKTINLVTCDICKNELLKPVQFTCNLHSQMCGRKDLKNRSCSILSTKNQFSQHKDSTELIPLGPGVKDVRSVYTQAGDKVLQDNSSITEGDLPLQLVSVIKGSRRSKKSLELIEDKDITRTPSKLKNYLMKAVQINEIVLNNDNKM